MAIVKRPGAGSGKKGPVDEKEQAIEQFIASSGGAAGSQGKVAPTTGTAGEAVPVPAKTKKVPIIVYFDPDVVQRVGQAAKAKGLSRSSWLHQLAIEALEQ